MIYEFACDDCRIVAQVDRPVEQAGEQATCEWCGEPMRRIFHAPSLLGRSKPGSFKWDKCRLNGWDDRLATLRDYENRGSAALSEFRGHIGEKLFNATAKYKKVKYG